MIYKLKIGIWKLIQRVKCNLHKVFLSEFLSLFYGRYNLRTSRGWVLENASEDEESNSKEGEHSSWDRKPTIDLIESRDEKEPGIGRIKISDEKSIYSRFPFRSPLLGLFSFLFAFCSPFCVNDLSWRFTLFLLHLFVL